MQAEDRPIHFSTELIHGPRKHEVAMLQKLYFELSQTRQASYMNTDFPSGAPPRFYTKRGKAKSVAVFLPDRLLFIEEWVDIPLSVFLERVTTATQKAMEVLAIPSIALQTATIRTTFALTHFSDSRVFLMDNACAQTGRIGPHFKRPIAIGGLRFVLPETPEHRGNLHVTIESYRHGQHEVYVEVKGVFANPPITTENLALLEDNIRLVRNFILKSVHPYLAQFDVTAGN